MNRTRSMSCFRQQSHRMACQHWPRLSAPEVIHASRHRAQGALLRHSGGPGQHMQPGRFAEPGADVVGVLGRQVSHARPGRDIADHPQPGEDGAVRAQPRAFLPRAGRGQAGVADRQRDHAGAQAGEGIPARGGQVRSGQTDSGRVPHGPATAGRGVPGPPRSGGEPDASVRGHWLRGRSGRRTGGPGACRGGSPCPELDAAHRS
jgi:hypothetical protein